MASGWSKGCSRAGGAAQVDLLAGKGGAVFDGRRGGVRPVKRRVDRVRQGGSAHRPVNLMGLNDSIEG